MTKRLTVVMCALVLSGACGGEKSTQGAPTGGVPSAAPAQAIKVSSLDELYPFSVGNAWTYYVETTMRRSNGQVGNASFERVLKVTNVTETAAGKEVVIEHLDAKGKSQATMVLEVRSDGIYQKSIAFDGKTMRYTPPQPFINWPISKTEVVNWEGKGPIPGETSEYAIKARVVNGTESEVDTLTKRYRAYRFDVMQEFTFKKVKVIVAQIQFYTPGIGLVRSKESFVSADGAGQEATMVLKSFTVK